MRDEAPSGAVATGTLWIVATPIGTLGDLSPRAREVFARVEAILAEDTRRTRALLSAVGLATSARLESLHEHNEQRRVGRLVDRLRGGQEIALVADAGTPVLSDPGFLLLRAARAAGIRVASVPGASSFTAALAASGQPPLPATLVGFLPPRRGARRRRVAELGLAPWTLVVLLSPHRIEAELADLADGLGSDRPATLLAELSKVHERASVATLGELAGGVEATSPRGEYVVVIGPAPAADAAGDPDVARSAFEDAVASGCDRREAVREAARVSGLPRREVYEILLALDRTEDTP